MSEPSNISEPQPAQPPTCPHCKEVLREIGLYNWVFVPWAILEAHCPHCRALLHMQFVPLSVINSMAATAAAPVPEGPKIVKPS